MEDNLKNRFLRIESFVSAMCFKYISRPKVTVMFKASSYQKIHNNTTKAYSQIIQFCRPTNDACLKLLSIFLWACAFTQIKLKVDKHNKAQKHICNLLQLLSSSLFASFSTILKSASRYHLLVDLETLDDAIGLHGRQNDVHQPETKKQSGGEDFRSLRSAQFPTDLRPAAVHEDGDTDEGKDGEKGDGES